MSDAEPDRPPPDIILALHDALVANLDIVGWRRLAMLLGESETVGEHPRLLRSLHFDDEDYPEAALAVLETLLSRHEARDIAETAGLEEWLGEHRPSQYTELFPGRRSALRTAQLSEAEMLNGDVIRDHLRKMQEQADTDPSAAISSAKNLVESTTKLVLETLGVEYSDTADVPTLAREAQRNLAIHPEALAPDAAGADTIRKILGALATVANGVAELRNQYGDGHGRTSVVYGLNARHAHLAVGAADTYCRMLLTTLADPAAPWREPVRD